ncbi:hypothetical protein CYLTODRAFT_486594 [Cylindrobasidium torrendii FP15055 ss-10]|uniref:Uncharacterized protein n=1 Tax=Cylindrobasidium torrendii FP15055 ss-10 TaxID=1314674 RepID=A0A0D7BPW4_9AGAR|nr:hypothetical protein CYLTODRAFT_486594 [Cylindrobasidium torrendii FP15055 ss-10]
MSYLLSRWLDPVLGVCTGFLAFYLHETHPRTGLPEEKRLRALLQWRKEKDAKLAVLEAGRSS